MKTSTISTSCILLFTFSLTASAADYSVAPLKEKPPADELPKAIADQLAQDGLTVKKGSRTLCNLWWCKQWNVKEGFKPTLEVLYPFQPGHLVGVAQFKSKSADFRDQEIPRGLYTVRYMHQPIDGNHVGTSPTRDFFLLVSVEKDKSAEPLAYDKLVKHSADSVETTHPAMLCLQAPADKSERPAIVENEDREWWILRAEGTAKAGEKTTKQPVDFVIVGHADE